MNNSWLELSCRMRGLFFCYGSVWRARKTGEFVEQLRGARAKHVMFLDENDTTIRGGYLTKLKAVTFDGVDCGGQKDH
jgi:hypothetical protein